MGVVYAAQRLTLGDTVAIKCILPHRNSELNRARFVREARAAARIRHPNVVQVFDFGEFDAAGSPYMVMEYLDGPTLFDVLSRGRPTLERAMGMFAEICAAVQAGHRRGIVHRDIKPGNVIIDRSDDGSEAAKVLDFGLAVSTAHPSKPANASSMLVGTVDYMSPEQVAGRPVSPASDVFSLAVLLYEMTTGCLPFRGDNAVGTLLRITEGDYAPPTEHAPGLPEAVVEAIVAGLQVEPSDRPRSALDLARALGVPVAVDAAVSVPLSVATHQQPPSTELAEEGAPTVEATRSDPGRLPFIGREAELGIVDNELEAARSQPGRFLLVTADVGIGKSRFVDEVAAHCRAAQVTVVQGRFYAYEGDRPPTQETFAWMAGAASAGGKEPGAAAVLGRDDRWRIFEEVATTLLEGAGSDPLVLIIDDLQWASRIDVDFLAYLQHASRDRVLWIVAAARPGLPPEVERFVGQLASGRKLRRIQLAPFEADATHAWLRAHFGRLRIQPGDVRRLQHVTSGNPFALGEVVRQLEETGRVRKEDDGWACDDLYDVGLPDTVQAVVESQLQDLNPEVRSALEVACVVGQEFRFETVHAAADAPEAQLEALLEDAVEKRLLADRGLSHGSDYRFSSDGLRRVLYESLAPRRRRKLHRRVVDALSELYASDGMRLDGVIAYHLDAIGDWAEALPRALSAASRSFVLYDSDGAQRSVERAARAATELAAGGSPASPAELAQLEFLRGAIDAQLGRNREALPALGRAIDLAEGAELQGLALRARLARVDCQLGLGEFAVAADACIETIKLAKAVGDWESEALARIAFAGCAGPLGRFEAAQAAIAPVLNTTRNEDARVRALALRELAWLESKQGNFTEAKNAATDAASAARQAADAMAQYRAASALGFVHAECGDYREAVEHLRTALELARALSLRRREGIELCNVGECLLELGEAEAALSHTRDGLSIFLEIGDRACEGDCRVNLGRMMRSLGRTEEARAMLERGRDVCATSGRLEYEAIALCELGDVRMDDGDPMLARVCFERARQTFEQLGAFQRWQAVFGLARAARALGEGGPARARADEAIALLTEQLDSVPAGVSAANLRRARADVERFIESPIVAPTQDGVEPTDRATLEAQHRELSVMARELVARVPPSDADASADVHARIQAVAAALRVHQEAENRGLYPRLLGHADAEIRTRAEGLYGDGLASYEEYFAFALRWSSAARVQEDPARCAEEAAAVFDRLGARMRREEAELHPLAEA